MKQLLIAITLLTGTSASAQTEHYLALAYSSRQVYIVSNGGTRSQCQSFINARGDRARVKYACVSRDDARRLIEDIFGRGAAENL